jgi:anti-sigma factor ChrR (cupin superfamily)
MRLPKRGDDHVWSQQRLSQYVEGEMSWRSRRRLQLHAEECPECSLGIRAVRALLRLLNASAQRSDTRAPTGIFDRVRRDAARTGTEAKESDEP